MPPIRIVSHAEAEAADFVVCPPVGPSVFSDNQFAHCSDCGCEVMHRPHAPKRPPKICIRCANDRAAGGQA